MKDLSYYMHERAEESRHNEARSLLIAVIGAVFLVGGILQTVVVAQTPEWFLIFPYQLGSSPYEFSGLAFTILGVAVFSGGIILGVHCRAQRLWYSNELKELYKIEEQKLRAKTSNKKKPKIPELSVADSEAMYAFSNR
jgi:uncharacterized membrane protein YciS (DUF1049 family)